MKTLFLKFDSKEQFQSLLAAEGVEPSAEITGKDYNLSVLGYSFTVIDGEEAVDYTKGYLVNGIGTLPSSFSAYLVTVTSPKRVFAE